MGHVCQDLVLEQLGEDGGALGATAEPGEYYNAFDGNYGGLWRRSGRPPQVLAGVGFSAQGTFVGSYYRRNPDTYDNTVSWVFDGVDDVLGDFGLCGGGAAGFELDRVDERLGSPHRHPWGLLRERAVASHPLCRPPQSRAGSITLPSGDRAHCVFPAELE